MNFSPEINLQ